jgi:predicted transcriptional regulator
MDSAAMKKTNHVAAKLASELFGESRIYDAAAETTEEIAAKLGISETSARRQIRNLSQAGKIEQVWKRIESRPVHAYRVKK